MKKNKSLTEMMLNWDSRAIAEKMLKTVKESTPEEIGRVILRSKRHRQTVLNLQPKH